MSQQSEPDIRQTAQEKVLIKHQAMKASRYQKVLITQAKKQAAEHCQLAQQEAQEIRHIAYQQGYQQGLQKLLADLLLGLESSQRQYQQALASSEEQLQTLLTEIFSDTRMYEIVSDHFIRQHPEYPQTQIHLPPSLLHKLKPTLAEIKHLTILSGSEKSIALEIDNEILHFSPESATQRILPHILSLPARCTILQTQQVLYRNFSEQLNQSREPHDNFNTELHIENDNNNHGC
ncbi:HrpE/YscL family type III secretion apparatus protein [Yersinia hibernica]|uniref:Oxygen-regulated invasion protein OrgB n=1 Tax=Yersinia hibernica TaxID=2339259 RepID=A0ABX5R4U6_9GAMM|nr:HrpE/YscL family type III secretion apparatus protein [Yersinia hibernica]QAX80386.1 hypothetical protein D5F51_18740 [Yersinia hibernica]